MKDTNKAPYQAPGMGDVELMLERAVLTTSDVMTPKDADLVNEGVTWVTEY